MSALRCINLIRKNYAIANLLIKHNSIGVQFLCGKALPDIRCAVSHGFKYLGSPVKPSYFCTTKSTFCTSATSDENVKKAIDRISEKFSEAIGLLEDARGSLNTVYFSEDMKEAELLVVEILNDFDSLLEGLDSAKRTEVQRTIGLKISELKAQMKMVKELCENTP